MEVVIVEEEVKDMEVVTVEEEAMEVVIVVEEDMEIMVTTQVAVIMVVDITPKEVKVAVVTMVVDITPKEVKVAVVTIPREVNLNGNILPCVSDITTECRVGSILVVLALLVLILMFIQKMVQDLRETLIASWGKLHERKILYLNQMENSFIKEACCCLSYRGISIL